MTKKRKQPKMKARDALDLIDDSVGDGAALFMAAEMAGMDYDEFIAELANDAEE